MDDGAEGASSATVLKMGKQNQRAKITKWLPNDDGKTLADKGAWTKEDLDTHYCYEIMLTKYVVKRKVKRNKTLEAKLENILEK